MPAAACLQRVNLMADDLQMPIGIISLLRYRAYAPHSSAGRHTSKALEAEYCRDFFALDRSDAWRRSVEHWEHVSPSSSRRSRSGPPRDDLCGESGQRFQPGFLSGLRVLPEE